jgi:hypothetical protein
MTLRREYTALQPEFDEFLFAAVGEEIDGIPLTTISMLTQLGFDPWRESGRLASLAKRDATEQLAQIIARLPRPGWVAERRGEIARTLIELLPQRAKTDEPARPGPPRYRRPGYWTNISDRAKTVLIGSILAAAVVITLVARQGWPFGH